MPVGSPTLLRISACRRGRREVARTRSHAACLLRWARGRPRPPPSRTASRRTPASGAWAGALGKRRADAGGHSPSRHFAQLLTLASSARSLTPTHVKRTLRPSGFFARRVFLKPQLPGRNALNSRRIPPGAISCRFLFDFRKPSCISTVPGDDNAKFPARFVMAARCVLQGPGDPGRGEVSRREAGRFAPCGVVRARSGLGHGSPPVERVRYQRAHVELPAAARGNFSSKASGDSSRQSAARELGVRQQHEAGAIRHGAGGTQSAAECPRTPPKAASAAARIAGRRGRPPGVAALSAPTPAAIVARALSLTSQIGDRSIATGALPVARPTKEGPGILSSIKTVEQENLSV